GAQVVPCHLEVGIDRLAGLAHAARHPDVPDEHVGPVHRHRHALGDLVHHRGPDVVDERDAGLAEQQRPQVGVAAGDRPRGVHDGRGRGVDERLGGDAVEVGVVDHRDLPGPEALDQPLRPTVDARDPGHRRRRPVRGLAEALPEPERRLPGTDPRVAPALLVRRAGAVRFGRVRRPACAGRAVPDPSGGRRVGPVVCRGPPGRRDGAVVGATRWTPAPRVTGHVTRPRSPAAVARSSVAWMRAATLSGCPDSMRDSSMTRWPSSSTSTWDTVESSSACFATRTCASAYAATCARWVTTRTWCWRAMRARARPTAPAAAPPMPASTSSNTRVGCADVSTRRNASMVLASSPPEA